MDTDHLSQVCMDINVGRWLNPCDFVVGDWEMEILLWALVIFAFLFVLFLIFTYLFFFFYSSLPWLRRGLLLYVFKGGFFITILN